jgi:AAA ATPase domain
MTGGEPDGGREHGARYCSRCGQELAERAAAQRSREVRKRVTVLQPTPGWRLLSIRRDTRARPRWTPARLIGRDPELNLLRAQYKRTVDRRVWRSVKVLGDAGAGRSRLVDAFTRGLGGDPEFDPPPLVLWGRCSSYFDRIRADPIAQILQQAAGIEPDDSASTARGKLHDLAGHNEHLAARVAPVLGLPGSPGQQHETWLALRRVFEMLASRQPLVLVIDDLHAAQASMREAVEALAASPSRVPILMLCTIRSESLDEIGNWGERLLEVDSFKTPLLDPEETRALISDLLAASESDRGDVERIAAQAHGNPRQVKELVASLAETGTLRPAANLEAVLEARLDGLSARENQVIEAAAVVNAWFTITEIGALCPDLTATEILEVLSLLEYKELLTPDVDHERFALRNRYRSVAYRRLTKERRGGLHVHYASLLEIAADGEPQPEIDARIGVHLHGAYRYQQELHLDLTGSKLGLDRRAGEHFAAAGHAYSTQLFPDPSTAELLERASDLLTNDLPTGRQARLDLANLLQEDRPEVALALYDEVLEAADRRRDRVIGQQAKLGRMEGTWFRNFQGDRNEGCSEVEQMLDELTDPLCRAKAWRLLAHAYAASGKAGKAVDAVHTAAGPPSRQATKDSSQKCTNARASCSSGVRLAWMMWSSRSSDTRIELKSRASTTSRRRH